MKAYGCCWCQTEHLECDPLYGPHLMSQSKHGLYEVDVYVAIIAAHMRAQAMPDTAAERKVAGGQKAG